MDFRVQDFAGFRVSVGLRVYAFMVYGYAESIGLLSGVTRGHGFSGV